MRGGLESLVKDGKEWLYRSPRPTFWRATTDNDRGNGFSEEDSEAYPMSRAGISMELEIPEDVKNLRLDPGEAAGGLVLRKLAFENDIKADFTTNGFPLSKNVLSPISNVSFEDWEQEVLKTVTNKISKYNKGFFIF